MEARARIAVLGLLSGVATCACGTAAGPGGPAPTSAPSSSASAQTPEGPLPQPAPEPPASAAPPGSGAATTRADFHCFSWVHGPKFSTDCFRDAETCGRERIAMQQGARDTMKCSQVKGASCTRVSRPPAPGDSERCFGNANNCERYRAFVRGNGLTVTPCEDR